MENQIELKVKEIFVNVFKGDINLENMGQNDKFSELGLSSVSFIKVIVAIENEFEIEFDDADLKIKNFENLGSFLEIINEKLQSKNEVV